MDLWVVLTTLIVYKIVLLGIGFLAQRRTKDETDMYLGGRNLGPLVAAVSASASSSSVWTLLGVSGMAYMSGLGAIWLFPSCVGGFALNWFVLAPRLRSHSAGTGSITLTEVLAQGTEEGSGRRTVVWIASLIILVSLMTYVASQFNGAAKSFAPFFPKLDANYSILIGSAIVVIYTMVGGFWAVSLTDTLQGLVMAATAVLLPIACLAQVGGFGALAEALENTLAPDDAASYFSLTKNLPWVAGVGFAAGLMGIGLGYPGQPHVVNRFMALRSEAAVRTARRISMTWAVLVYAGMILVGLCARAILGNPEDLGFGGALYDKEQAFFDVALATLPSVVAGIMLAAVLSAIMSTADSQLLVAAATVSHDMGLRGRTKKTQLLRDRLVILGLSVAAILAAIFGSREIFTKVLYAWTSMGAAFGPLLFWILFRGRVPAGAALTSMLVGFSSAVLFYYQPLGWQGFEKYILPYVLSSLALLLMARRR